MKLRDKKKEQTEPRIVAQRFIDALKPGDDIDSEIEMFASIFYDVCDAYADALNAQREAKEQYEIVASEVEQRVWAKNATQKLAVARAKSMVEADPFVVRAAKRLRRTTNSVTKLEALRMSFQQKASMLKAKVELIAVSYSQRDHIKPKTRRHDG